MITLIDAVRKTRKNDHRYFAVDKNLRVYSYHERALSKRNDRTGKFTYRNKVKNPCKFLGKISHLNCSWKKTLIDVIEIKVK